MAAHEIILFWHLALGDSSMEYRQTAPPLQLSTVLGYVFVNALVIGGGFVFVTTAFFDIKVSSTQWLFFLFFAFLLLVLAVAAMLGSAIGIKLKFLVGAVLIALTVALVHLGKKARPFKTAYDLGPMGLIILGPDSSIPTRSGDTIALSKQVDESRFLPAVVDQGSCGSCWAVASACAMSARYSRFKASSANPLPAIKAETTCVSEGVDTSKWHVSPQFILDKAQIEDSLDSCSPLSFGKCSGNTAAAGFKLAIDGAPNDLCVPYFGGSKTCNLSCGSPVSSYPACPATNTPKYNLCIHGSSFEWTTCANTARTFKKIAKASNLVQITDETTIQNEIFKNGPVACAVFTYRKADLSGADWTLIEPGGRTQAIINSTYISRPANDGAEYRRTSEGHLFVVYGYGETVPDANGKVTKYWMVRNSWGSTWGDKGNIKIEKGVNAWGIEENCMAADMRDNA